MCMCCCFFVCVLFFVVVFFFVVFFIGLIVNNRAIVYKHQHFLKVVVHVIIIDQRNQTGR